MAVANSSAVTIFFLRTLIAIDCEVVDREIPRTKQVLIWNLESLEKLSECLTATASVLLGCKVRIV